MDILKTLDNEYNKKLPPPNSITARQYTEHMKELGNPISKDKARVFIENMVQEGVLIDAGQFGPKREHHYILSKDGNEK